MELGGTPYKSACKNRKRGGRAGRSNAGTSSPYAGVKDGAEFRVLQAALKQERAKLTEKARKFYMKTCNDYH